MFLAADLWYMVSNFPNKKAYNPGGYTKFYFLPSYHVDTFPMIVNGRAQVPVGLKVGAMWYEGYATPGTLSYSEEAREDPNGKYYLPVLTGFVPGDKPALINLLQNMEKLTFIVMLRDSAGKFKLIGSPGCPLELSANFGSGEKRADSKGFSFKFTGQAFYRAPEAAL